MASAQAREIRIAIDRETDIVAARRAGRDLAAWLGFHAADQTLIASAIAEVARNIVVYAQRGEIAVCRLDERQRVGIRVVASDHGPGIENVALALRDGYSTKHSLGLGLPGARRLMDELHVESEVGQGTVVTMKKWVRM
ncbi:MAG TPA: anti-sigma regulatory factor [Kofleriaceae bacterium]|nr:anti-sigma regulatory factor [Kofleriaceae bacterium]